MRWRKRERVKEDKGMRKRTIRGDKEGKEKKQGDRGVREEKEK